MPHVVVPAARAARGDRKIISACGVFSSTMNTGGAGEPSEPTSRRGGWLRRRSGGRGLCLPSALDERQQVGVDGRGLGGGHAVREALVGLERPLPQELG